MAIKRVTRERLRLVVLAVALVPLAILARAAASGKLTELVQRIGAKAWLRYDTVRGVDEAEPAPSPAPTP